MSQSEFGYIFGSNAAGLIAGSQINRLFLKRFTTFEITYVVSLLLVIITVFGLGYVLFVDPVFMVVYPTLFFMMTFVGFQNPNVTALSLQPFTKRAGSASAFVGAVSMIFGSFASWYVSYFLNASLLPLFIMLSICSILAHICVEVYKRKYGSSFSSAKTYIKHPYYYQKRQDSNS